MTPKRPGSATRAAREAVAARALRQRGPPAPRPARQWPRRLVLGIAAATLFCAAMLAWVWRDRPVPAPVAAAPVAVLGIAELLAGHSAGWRIARLRENPAVLVIEFPDLAEQGSTMNRIAALLEKAGAPRDRVLNDAELAELIRRNGDDSRTFYQGHDYDAAGLTRFYRLASAQQLALRPQEERLRRELRAAGVTVADATGDRGVQALITFTAVEPAAPGAVPIDAQRREAVLRHEVSHGRFYTQAAYRDHCRRFWQDGWTASERERMRRFLQTLGYDPHNEDLMLNEAQAFAMNTPDDRAFNARSAGLTDAELARLRERFWQTLPAEAEVAARAGTPAAASASTLGLRARLPSPAE